MAKVVYVLRHAKSSWAEDGLADQDRPLAPRGISAARAIAGHLKGRGIAPALVLCSPARRARETIDLARRGLPKGTEVRVEDSLYGAGSKDILRMLRALPDDLPSVMVVGHNPVLQELTLSLAAPGAGLGAMTGKFPTGALAELHFPVGTWKELGPGGAELAAYVIPKDLA